jgi:outer membrane protein, adhesin transport system
MRQNMVNRHISLHGQGALVALLVLSACMQGGAGGARSLAGPAGTEGVMQQTAAPSALIQDLQARRSVLPPNGAFHAVAEQILAASKGAAAAELRVAQLRAQAQEKNWLPQIGPSVSLSSLSGLVASLTLTQPLLDNGRRRAAREFAAADVEVAAVSLSQAMNQRVYEGLVYYVEAQRAQAQAAVSRRGLERLARFQRLMQARVEGGLSDMSEQNVIDQRYSEIQAQIAADVQAAAMAQAQLAALIGGPGGDSPGGIDRLGDLRAGPAALSVLRQRGEGARLLAQAAMSRSDMLPGVAADADVMPGGKTATGLRLTGLGMLNPGAGDTMQALDETQVVVARQTAEAEETAQRRLVALSGEIDSLNSRAAQGAKVLAQTEGNLDLFSQQYELGRRSLLELVSQYDAFAQLERDQAAISYEVARRSLEIARDLGLLVDGERL